MICRSIFPKMAKIRELARAGSPANMGPCSEASPVNSASPPQPLDRGTCRGTAGAGHVRASRHVVRGQGGTVAGTPDAAAGGLTKVWHLLPEPTRAQTMS